MAGDRRRRARILGAREAQAIAANLGRDARATRQRRRLTQAELGGLLGLSQAEVSRLERGRGVGASIETWVTIGIALERPVAIGFSRDIVDPPSADAGHLAAQELFIRIAARADWTARFEVPSRPDDPRHATDIVLCRAGVTVLVEVWNRLDDLGAAVRSSDRKLADVTSTKESRRSLWVLVENAANREIARRYPAILRSRFNGSSSGWIRAVEAGGRPPIRSGLAWIDVRSGRIRELRPPTA